MSVKSEAPGIDILHFLAEKLCILKIIHHQDVVRINLLQIRYILLIFHSTVFKTFCVWENRRGTSTETVASLTTHSEMDCLVSCTDDETCVSVNFYESINRCELFSEDLVFSWQPISDDTSKYYTKLPC